MFNFKNWIFTVVLIIITIPVMAQEEREIIREIKFIGATKTKLSHLQRRVNIYEGDLLSAADLEDLKIRLSQNPQFNLKNVQLKEGVLTIDIEDKWTIIPVPLISQSGEYYMRGMGLYDNNFLGRLETFVPAVAWTNSGINYLLLYNSENFFSPNFGLSSLIVQLNSLSYFYRNDQEVNKFEARTKAFEFTPNFFYKNIVFKSGPVFFSRKIYEGNSKTPLTFNGSGLRSRLHMKYYEQFDVLYKGFFITGNAYVLRKQQDDDFFFHGKIEFDYSYPVFENHYIGFMQNFGIASDKTYFYPFTEGAHEGFRGYDGESIHMQRYSSSTLQYQHNIWKRMYGLLFYENNQTVLINPIFNGRKLKENTVGTGLRYYLKQISIPGINVEYGYNLDDKSSHIHFNVGLKL